MLIKLMMILLLTDYIIINTLLRISYFSKNVNLIFLFLFFENKMGLSQSRNLNAGTSELVIPEQDHRTYGNTDIVIPELIMQDRIGLESNIVKVTSAESNHIIHVNATIIDNKIVKGKIKYVTNNSSENIFIGPYAIRSKSPIKCTNNNGNLNIESLNQNTNSSVIIINGFNMTNHRRETKNPDEFSIDWELNEAPLIHGLSLSGGGNVVINDNNIINSGGLECKMLGSGGVILNNLNISRLYINSLGSSNNKITNSEFNEANIKVCGSGRVNFFSSNANTFNGSIIGSGNISGLTVKTICNVNICGSGNI